MKLHNKSERAFRERTPLEKDEYLNKQFQTLQNLCNQYDNGDTLMIDPISGVLRNLLHQSGKSTASLKQSGRWSTRFIDSFVYPTQKNLLIYNGMTGIYISQDGQGIPYAGLDDWPSNQKSKRQSWWEKKVLWSPYGKFSRSELVLFKANQEALHMEKKGIDEVFEQLRSLYSEMPNLTIHGTTVLIEDIVAVTIRQVAHEVLATLINGYTKTPNLNAKILLGPIESSLSVDIVAIDK